jgi:hypothetical protein
MPRHGHSQHAVSSPEVRPRLAGSGFATAPRTAGFNHFEQFSALACFAVGALILTTDATGSAPSSCEHPPNAL